MLEVTKDQFYRGINPLDVVGSCWRVKEGHYRTQLKLRNGVLVGQTDTHFSSVATTTYLLNPFFTNTKES